MKPLLLFLIFLVSAPIAFAQSFLIKGTVSDTLNVRRLPRASVTLIRASDSVIVAHARTGVDGGYELKVIKEGKYVIRISFIGFADFEDVVKVSKPVTDMGEIPMITKEHLLSEFVITQQIAAIKIKGDTTEYVADSFKVKEGANVEDLLKRLPGIHVDKNGKITAQGETVQKVLVDGEEFFSDDPKVVTQGLQATVVDKVQVYDKKSDQAEFTGIDDGQKTKTINLELKEDKKKGFFGKLSVGGGTDGYYQNQGMLNAFKGKRQLSAFGIVSNTDKVGLGWGDNDKYGGGSGIMELTDNGYYTSVGGSYDDFGGWSGNYQGEGLPSVATGGIHFADRWKHDQNHVSASYRYAQQNVDVTGDNITQNSLAGDSVRISTEHKMQASRVERQALNGFYEWTIDTNTSVRMVMGAGQKHSDVSSHFYSETWNRLASEDVSLPKTTNDRLLTGNTKTQNVNADMLFKKKFAKKGRTISLDVKEVYDETKGTGMLNSIVAAPDSAGHIVTTTTDQKKTDSTHSSVFSAKATYTEPLSKKAFLELSYGASVNNSLSKKYSYSKDPATGGYDVVNDSFSSNYKYNIVANRAGISFKFVYKNYNFNFGTDVTKADYLQTDVKLSDQLHKDYSLRYGYTNFYPKAGFSYKWGKQTTLRINYDGSSKQPTITEIQPLAQNTDPLNVMVGNANLKQQFTNTVRLNFSDYKVLSHRYFYVGGDVSSEQNAITTEQTTSGPYSTTKYINVNGNYSADYWMGYDFKLKKPNLGIGFSASGNNNHSHNTINGVNNVNDNANYRFGPNFSVEKEEKYEFSLTPNAIWNQNHSTVSTYSTNYWAFEGDFNASAHLPGKWEVGSTVNAMVREKTVAFPVNNQVIKWNASVSKKFMKKGQLETKITLYDILNQNAGYSRTATGNTIVQMNYNTVRRYAMLSLIWNFTHTPGGAVAGSEDK